VPSHVTGRDVLASDLDPQLNYQVQGTRSDGVTFEFTGLRTDPNQRSYHEVLTVEFKDGLVTVDSEAGQSFVTGKGITKPLSLSGTDYDVRFTAVNENFTELIQGTGIPYVSTEQIWRNTKATVDLDTTGLFDLTV
jgi:hypothetical protein